MSEPTLFLISRGLLEHKDRMGPAIWEYLWFVDRVTEDVPDGDGKFSGLVLGGKPVTAAQIAQELNEHPSTAKRNIRLLEQGGYILRKKLGDNTWSAIVTNSKKWFWRRAPRTKNAPTLGAEIPPPSEQPCTDPRSKNGTSNKEDKTVTRQREGRARQIPADFSPNDGHRQLAIDLGVNLETAVAKFRDHHLSRGSTFKDWDAALRNWIRKEAEYAAQVRQPKQTTEAGRPKLPPIDLTPPVANPKALEFLRRADATVGGRR